jgi:hypothetical protein
MKTDTDSILLSDFPIEETEEEEEKPAKKKKKKKMDKLERKALILMLKKGIDE